MHNSNLKSETPQNKRQFVTYLCIGGLNTLFGYTCYIILLYLGLQYSIALLLSMCMGVIFNFITTGRLVFLNKQFAPFGRFICLYAFLYLINLAIIKSAIFFGMNSYAAGLIAIIPVALVGFILSKQFVFS